MPSVSRRQQRYLFANFGPEWVKKHGFDVLDPSARKHPSPYRRKYGLNRHSALGIALMGKGKR